MTSATKGHGSIIPANEAERAAPRIDESTPAATFLGPEAYRSLDARRFERLPLVLRRLTFSTVWRRIRMPVRRRRWDKMNRRVAAAYVKSEIPDPGFGGLAVAVGEFSAPTGLGQAARAYLADIEARHIAAGGRVLHIDLGRCDSSRAARVDAGAGEFARAYLLCQPENYARALGHLAPGQVARAWRIGTMVWETPIFPRHWDYALDLVHEMWCPTEFCAGAIRRCTPKIAVDVHPYPPYVDLSAPALDRASFDLRESDFIGIAIMDLQVVPERKNPLGTVIAWKRAFGDDPSKVLLMKIRTGKRTGVVRHEIAELAGRGGGPNVRIVEREFSRAEITGLQKMADVLVSLHRSEGYGLNIRECLDLGTPVVATHWSGNAEFGPDFAGYHPVPCRMVPNRDWMGEYAGQRFEWADADLDAAAAALRALADAKSAGR